MVSQKDWGTGASYPSALRSQSLPMVRIGQDSLCIPWPGTMILPGPHPTGSDMALRPMWEARSVAAIFPRP